MTSLYLTQHCIKVICQTSKGELKDDALELAIEWYHQYIVTQAGKGGVARSQSTSKDNIKKATKDAPTQVPIEGWSL